MNSLNPMDYVHKYIFHEIDWSVRSEAIMKAGTTFQVIIKSRILLCNGMGNISKNIMLISMILMIMSLLPVDLKLI